MINKLNLSQWSSASLYLHLPQNTYFIHPPATSADLALGEEDEVLVRGTVTFSCAKSRNVVITAELIGQYVLNFPPGTPGHSVESGEFLHETVKRNNGEAMLYPPGDTTFEFSFLVKNSQASFEKTPYARIGHKIRVTAHAAGVAGADVIVEKPVYFITNAARKGEAPASLDMRLEGLDDTLGPYCAVAQAEILTVARLMTVGIKLPAPNKTVKLHRFQAYIVQTMHLIPWKTKTAPISCPPQRISLISKDLAGQMLGPGNSLDIEETARLPTDNLMRPSTNDGTCTPCRINHMLYIELEYTSTIPGSKRATLQFEKPLKIASCCCVLESLLLPSYTDALFSPIYDFTIAAKYHITPHVKKCPSAACRMDCACGLTLDELFEERLSTLDREEKVWDPNLFAKPLREIRNGG